jgi:hypothetical protein
MTKVCIQIQPQRAPDIDLGIVREVFLAFGLQVDERHDDESYINFMFETDDVPSLWQKLKSELYGSNASGEALLAASIVVCEGKTGWDDYLLLHHFNNRPV